MKKSELKQLIREVIKEELKKVIKEEKIKDQNNITQQYVKELKTAIQEYKDYFNSRGFDL